MVRKAGGGLNTSDLTKNELIWNFTFGVGDGDEDLEAEEDLDVLNPKECILLEISFEALSTTPGVLTLIAVGFYNLFIMPMEWH